MIGPTRSRSALRTILRAHEVELRARGVASLTLFGSIGRGDATRASDVDLAVIPGAGISAGGFDCFGQLDAVRAAAGPPRTGVGQGRVGQWDRQGPAGCRAAGDAILPWLAVPATSAPEMPAVHVRYWKLRTAPARRCSRQTNMVPAARDPSAPQPDPVAQQSRRERRRRQPGGASCGVKPFVPTPVLLKLMGGMNVCGGEAG